MKKRIFDFTINDITEIAILCAIAILFDTFVKIPVGATGGSINFSMVPLIIICLRHGPFKGFISAAFVYGLITCFLDDYGPETYPLEYFIAFGSIAITGFVAPYINKEHKNIKSRVFSILLLALTLSIWATIRFFAASTDSVILYGLTYPEAFAYNALYIFISLPFDFVITVLLLPVVKRLNKTYKTSYLKIEKNITNKSTIKAEEKTLTNKEREITIKIEL